MKRPGQVSAYRRGVITVGLGMGKVHLGRKGQASAAIDIAERVLRFYGCVKLVGDKVTR